LHPDLSAINIVSSVTPIKSVQCGVNGEVMVIGVFSKIAPLDENEAAHRRAERWEPWPHTVGQSRFIPKIDFPPEGRHTLDLRRYPAQTR
jgi:hypothetical protein